MTDRGKDGRPDRSPSGRSARPILLSFLLFCLACHGESASETDRFDSPFPANMAYPYGLAPPPKYLVKIAGATHYGFRELPSKGDPNLGMYMRLFGVDPSDMGSVTPEQFSIGVLREFVEAYYGMVDEVGGSMAPCDFAVEGDWRIPTEDADRQREVLLRFATAFLDRYLKGIPDGGGILDGVWAGTQADLRMWCED